MQAASGKNNLKLFEKVFLWLEEIIIIIQSVQTS